MAGNGGEITFLAIARMTGNTLATMQYLYHVRRDACFQSLTDQGVRYAVTMTLHFNVIVDMNFDGFELRDLVTLQWQRHQCGRIQR